MVVPIYAPNIINSFISFAYCNKSELVKGAKNSIQEIVPLNYLGDGRLPMIVNVEKNVLCYLKFDKWRKDWILYHMMDDFVCDIILPTDLKTDHSYLAVLIDKKFDIIQSIDSKGIASLVGNHGFYGPDLYMFFKKSDTCYNYNMYIQDPFEKFNNIFVINANGGVVYLNSVSYLDLILSTMNAASTYEQTQAVFDVLLSSEYHQHLLTTFKNFQDVFENVQKVNPLTSYGQIYQYFNINDKEYYNTKMKIFRSEVVKLFSDFKQSSPHQLSKFYANFINNLKKDICLELSIVYHRLRHFSQERDVIYNKYRNHPYIKLIKMIHQKYLETKSKIDLSINLARVPCCHKTRTFISTDVVEKILFGGSDLIIYTEFTSMLLLAIKQRNELFVPMYELYLNSTKNGVKPKYNTKYNYFPFKIFSAKLFVMEHMLNVI